MKILYFDLEATGLDPLQDRIVEISMLLIDDDKGEELDRLDTLINPGRPIPPEVIAIHGIRDEDVADKPPIAYHLTRIAELFAKADAIGGYAVSYDLKLLRSELIRCDTVLDLDGKDIWDMQKIFFHNEPRTLEAAMQYYCNKKLEGAHRAMNDVMATAEVFKAQRQRYNLDLQDKNTRAYALQTLSLDSNGAFAFNEAEEVVLCFGKFKGRVMNSKDKEVSNYLSWMVGANFPGDTKRLAKALLRGKTLTRSNISAIASGEPSQN